MNQPDISPATDQDPSEARHWPGLTKVAEDSATKAATSLLNHPLNGSSRNCLAQALHAARGEDDVLFLSAPPVGGTIGHVVLRDRRTGAVREPDIAADAGASLAAYLGTSGREVLAAVSASLLRRVLALDPVGRARAIASIGAPLQGIQHLAFGIGGAIPIQPPHHPDPPPPTTMPNATDDAVKGWLDALGGAASTDDKKGLASTADDATTLLAWFKAHKRGDAKLNEMPQNVADAENRLLSDPSVANRITAQSGTDKGSVTRDTLGDFVKDMDDAANKAKTSWGDFQKANTAPDPVTLQRALDASILQANLPAFDAAGSASAKVDSTFNADDLKAIASKDGPNAHLPAALANAASFYLNSGEFDGIDVAGGGMPSTKTDGLVNNDDLGATIENDKANPTDTLGQLQHDALQKAVADAGGDASRFSPDYFKDPGTSTTSAADKTAALLQLKDTLARYDAGTSAYPDSGFISPDNYYGPGVGSSSTPGEQRDAFRKQISDRIDTLSKDKDVGAFLTDKLPGALQSVVGSDPALKAAVQKQYDATQGSKPLQDALGAKDDKGNPVGTTDALANFEKLPGFYGQALGKTPDDVKADFEKAFSGTPTDVQDKVRQSYQHIVSGGEIDDLTKAGTPQDQAIITSTGNKTVYDMVLDQSTRDNGTDKFTEKVDGLARAQLTDGKSVDDMLKGLGLSGLDDPNLEKVVNDNLNAIATPGDYQPKASDIAGFLRNVSDSMRGGLKFDDAMKKAQDGWSLKAPNLNDTYKSGIFHGASALLLGGVLATRLGTQGQGTDPKSVAQTVGQSLQIGGLLSEGGGKYYGTTLSALDSSVKTQKTDLESLKTQLETEESPALKAELQAQIDQKQPVLDADKSRLDVAKNVGKYGETFGKTIGGVAGNAIGCVLGAIGAADAAKTGDTGSTVVQSVFAGINGIATIASAGEVAAFVAPRVAGAIAPEIAEAVGGAFGAVGGAAGVVGGALALGALVGFGIYSLVKAVQAADKVYGSEGDWYKELQQGFAPAGVPLPSELALTDPADGPPPLDVPVSA